MLSWKKDTWEYSIHQCISLQDSFPHLILLPLRLVQKPRLWLFLSFSPPTHPPGISLVPRHDLIPAGTGLELLEGCIILRREKQAHTRTHTHNPDARSAPGLHNTSRKGEGMRLMPPQHPLLHLQRATFTPPVLALIAISPLPLSSTPDSSKGYVCNFKIWNFNPVGGGGKFPPS